MCYYTALQCEIYIFKIITLYDLERNQNVIP